MFRVVDAQSLMPYCAIFSIEEAWLAIVAADIVVLYCAP